MAKLQNGFHRKIKIKEGGRSHNFNQQRAELRTRYLWHFRALGEDSSVEVLNLWVAQGSPFPRGHLRPPENTGIYIMIHNSNKISYETKTILWLGITTWGTILNGWNVRKVESHCLKKLRLLCWSLKCQTCFLETLAVQTSCASDDSSPTT